MKNTFVTLMFALAFTCVIARAEPVVVKDIWDGVHSEMEDTQYGRLKVHPNQAYIDAWLRTVASAKLQCKGLNLKWVQPESGPLNLVVSAHLEGAELVKNTIKIYDKSFQFIATPTYKGETFIVALYTLDGNMTRDVLECVTPPFDK
jgi:hypothetical protein